MISIYYFSKRKKKTEVFACGSKVDHIPWHALLPSEVSALCLWICSLLRQGLQILQGLISDGRELCFPMFNVF